MYQYAVLPVCTFFCMNVPFETGYEPRREKTNILHMPKQRRRSISFAVTAVTAKLIDQRLCFRYTDSTIPLLSKSDISSL